MNNKEEKIFYLCDDDRHLICLPFSIDNLHKMAEDLGINKCWFHRGKYPHYDIPKKRMNDIKEKCVITDSRSIIIAIKNSLPELKQESYLPLHE